MSVQITGDKPNFDMHYVVIPAHTSLAFRTSPDGIEVEASKPLITAKYGSAITISRIVFNSDGTMKDFDAKGTLPFFFKERIKEEIEKMTKKWVLKFIEVLEKVNNFISS